MERNLKLISFYAYNSVKNVPQLDVRGGSAVVKEDDCFVLNVDSGGRRNSNTEGLDIDVAPTGDYGRRNFTTLHLSFCSAVSHACLLLRLLRNDIAIVENHVANDEPSSLGQPAKSVSTNANRPDDESGVEGICREESWSAISGRVMVARYMQRTRKLAVGKTLGCGCVPVSDSCEGVD